MSLSPFEIGVLLLVVLLACHEAGYRTGLRIKIVDEDYKRRVDMIRTIVLALVTFLIGFSFSAAGSRFIDRQDVIVKEANAIGTAYLRADLLSEPQRSALKAQLKQYASGRLELLATFDSARAKVLLDKADVTQKKIWQIGVEGVGTDRTFANFLLPSLNDVIDIHAEHLSAARRHIPEVILIVIVVASALGMALVGYDNGLVRKRFFVLISTFAIVSAASLWMTIDLDRPRHGLLRASVAPYTELIESMQ